MRSLYSGVSGLQNHQTRMDVIGNNVANVNTTGFKRGRVNFQDLLSQTMNGASRPNERVGGVNPQQIGLGMNVASIDTIHNQGSLQTTGVKTDVAIQGSGFFILREGEETFYTRAGVFDVDQQGTLVNPANGMRVQGWQAETIDGETVINTSATPGRLSVPLGSKDPAQATSEVLLASNLDKNTPIIGEGASALEAQAGTYTVEYDIYDSFGNTHTLRLDYTRVVGTENEWQGQLTINQGEETEVTPTVSIGGIQSTTGSTYNVRFDNDGFLQSVTNAEGGVDNQGRLEVEVAFDVPGASIPVDEATGLPGEPVTQTVNLVLGEVGANVDSTTQFAAESTQKAFSQDGYTMGYLDDFQIDQSGTIVGIYTNGTRKALGRIALATFINPEGLDKAGDNTYARSINSGEALIDPAGVADKGGIISGALEMSNVDLAEQFTDMIITQRGFQANSRTITTSDQMLQELLTLKR